MTKKILLYSGKSNVWGFRQLENVLHENFNVLDLNLNDSGETDLLYHERLFISRLEKFLNLFNKGLDTNNYKYGKPRNFLGGNMKLMRRVWHYAWVYFPKLLSSNQIASILSFFNGNIDSILEKFKPDIVLGVGFVLPAYPLIRASKLGYNVQCLIYSWDNPYKFSFLPSVYSGYLTWGELMNRDLEKLHGIESYKTHSVSAIQFDYINESSFLEKKSFQHPQNEFINNNLYKYYYFVCSCGYIGANQELIHFIELIKKIREVNSHVKFLVRLYPNGSYLPITLKELASYDGVEIETDYQKGMSQTDESMLTKLYALNYCKGLLHHGTTMALEAALLNKVVISMKQFEFYEKSEENSERRCLDFDIGLMNDHLDQYFFSQRFINTIFSREDLLRIFKLDWKHDDLEMLKYSRFLSKVVKSDLRRSSSELIVEHLKNQRIPINLNKKQTIN